jgi:predicted negative regulator of RcsB-dependent stress response
MDDYLSDEREQWETFKRWISEYGPPVLLSIAVVALGFGGYRWWQRHVRDRNLAAGAYYTQMQNALARGDSTQAFVLLGDIVRKYPSSPYADQARLAAAASFVQSGALQQAAGELRTVMLHSSDSDLRLLARVRLARVQIAMHRAEKALATLNGANPGAYAPLYAEVRGDAYYALGHKREALAQYRLARASDTNGVTDSALLDLEISDLSANLSEPKATSAAAAPGASAMPPASTTSHAPGGAGPGSR